MDKVFDLSAIVAVVATFMVITRRNAVHALLYMVVSFFAVAVVMLLLGAPFIAGLEVIVYAGAILVLFVFVIMMIGPESVALETRLWIGPSVLAAIVLAEIAWILARSPAQDPVAVVNVAPKQVGISLIGPYVIGVEVSAFLLLAGLVGAYHVGWRRRGER